MALINGALQIGRSGIVAAQAALAVAGNNMANAATPSYSRQTVSLRPTQSTEVVPGKYTGTGVMVYDIRRRADEALNTRLRSSMGETASNQILQQAMTRMEATFNELTDQDISTRLNAFFQAWSDLQKDPASAASRSVVMTEGAGLATLVSEIRQEMVSIQDDLDTQVRFQISEAGGLIEQIADLNEKVVVSEAGRAGSAAALRDQREDLLRQLGELISITTREVEGGAVNVFIGNDPLIQHADAREISYVEREDANGNWYSQVVFTHNEQTVDLTSGRVHGLLSARDTYLGQRVQELDAWTSTLIAEVNKIHGLGQGLSRYSSYTSAFAVDDPAVSLANLDGSGQLDTGLAWPVTNGVFYVQIYDSSGTPIGSPELIKVDIGIDATDTTLNSLAADLNAVGNLTATVDGSGRLQIQANSGCTFAFSGPSSNEDATNALAALGINTFFDGESAGDIHVRTDLDEAHIATSSNGLVGNGDVAASIAGLATEGIDAFNGLTLANQFTSMIGQIGADSKAAQDNYIASDVVTQTLESERQAISGVSVDEEAIHMIMSQRAFQGSAKFINIIDQMLDEIMSLAR